MGEQPILDVSFTYDYETYKKFLYYNWGINRTLLIVIIPIIFVVLLLGFIFDEPFLDVLSFLSGFLALILISSIFVLPPILYKKVSDMSKANQRLLFYKYHICGKSAGLTLNKDSIQTYDLFNRVCETRDAFYLYLKIGPAYIIAKKYLHEHQVILLHDFLVHRFEELYKYKK